MLRGQMEAVEEQTKQKRKIKEEPVVVEEKIVISDRPQKKHENTILIALDIGFGHSKALNSYNQMHVIPSYVEKAMINSRSSQRGKKELEIDKLTVYVNGVPYIVGKFASNILDDDAESNRISKRDRANDAASQALFLSMIGLSLPDLDEEFEVIIATGLPNEDFDTEIHDDLREFLLGLDEITFKTHNNVRPFIKKYISVKEVYVYRQPEGTLFDWLFKPNYLSPNKNEDFILGNFIDDPNGLIGIVDIGHLTLDCIVSRQMHIVENKSIRGNGFSQVYEKLAIKLSKFLQERQIEITFSGKDDDLDEIIRSKAFSSRVEDVNVSKVVDEVVNEYAKYVFERLVETWKQEINRFNQFILTGGAARIIQEPLNKLLQANKFQTLSEEPDAKYASPQLSNCRGFYIHALYDMRQDELYGDDSSVYWNLFIGTMKEKGSR